jgi:Tol biopolymer transport system component
MRKLLVLLIFGSWATMSWAWASPIPPSPELWVMASDGTDQRVLADSGDGFYGYGPDSSWSPDSGRMVSSGLFVIDVETGALTDLGSGRGPNWSPVGDQIVFSDTTSTQSFYDERLYVIDADGSDRRLLVDTGKLDSNAVWSPDGSKIAFVSGPGSGEEGQVFVVNADGTGLRQLTTAGSLYVPPEWSPDGNQLVFGTFGYVLYMLNVDGTDEQSLGAAHSSQPTWCPDGTLYFAGRSTDQDELGVYAVNAPGDFEFVVKGSYPDCSPAGRLAFTSSNGDIHIVDPGEAGTSNLTASDGRWDSSAKWSPDGTKITFTSTANFPESTKVERKLTLSLRKHLVASGRLTLESDSDCYTRIKLQRLAGGGWKTVKRVSSGFDQEFRVRIPDRAGVYRAVAPRRVSIFGEWECLRAVSGITRHRH